MSKSKSKRTKTKQPNGDAVDKPTKRFYKTPVYKEKRYAKSRKGVGGRPSKFKADIHIPIVLEVMSKGGVKASVIAKLYELFGISMPTFYNWMDKQPEFFKAVKLGEQLSEAWWVNKIKKNITMGTDKKFNAAPVIFLMKNAFNYSDKREVQQTETKEVNIKIDLSNSSVKELKEVQKMTAEERRKKFKVA